MDMKKILQALDNTASMPVEDSNDIAKFITIVNEGANPHKVALPVQMAMNHYQSPEVKTAVVRQDSLLKKYFTEAEEQATTDLEVEKEVRQQSINQYAQKIAYRVLEGKESARDKWTKASNEREKKHKEREAEIAKLPKEKRLGATIDALEKKLNEDNQPDVISVDVPLLIRLLEYAKEDAQTDMDLHNVAERLVALSTGSDVLNMGHYDAIIGNQEQPTEQ